MLISAGGLREEGRKCYQTVSRDNKEEVIVGLKWTAADLRASIFRSYANERALIVSSYLNVCRLPPGAGDFEGHGGTAYLNTEKS